MASTTFVPFTTVIVSTWAQDINDLTYLGQVPATATWYPNTANQLIYSSSAGHLTGLAAVSSAYLVTDGSGNISWNTTLPATTSTTITINGTASQIDVSGGAQSLAANRAWTVSIDAGYVGQTSITTLGTVSTGTWNGTNIAIAHGGTNSSTGLTNNQLMTSSAGAIVELGAMTNGQLVVGKTASAPQIVTVGGDVSTLSNAGAFTFSATNTNITSLANLVTVGTIGTGVWHGTIVGTTYGGTGLDTHAAANGTLLIGNGSGLTLATLTAGANITITNASGGITIAGSGGSGITVTGTANQIDVAGGGGATPTISISATYVGQTSITTLGTIGTGTWQGTAVGVGHGGTGVGSVTIAPTATAFAGWDANSNLSANSLIEGYQTIVTAAGTTALTVSSPFTTFFTGSTTQSVTMPVTSGLVLGQQYLISNRSTGVVTVKSSGANTIRAMEASSSALLTCILTSGTTAASWDCYFYPNTTGAIKVADGGTGVTSVTTVPANAFAGWDTSKNMQANCFIPGYATTATAAGTTTLAVTDAQIQFFTGATTQTVVLPVASTLKLGFQFLIENRSSGRVTVQSSGANNIKIMDGTTQCLLTCILASGTTAASWDFVYNGASGSTTTVSGGGTGVTSLTAYGLMCGGTTSTGTVQSLADGTLNNVLLSGGAGALPTWGSAVQSVVSQKFLATGTYTPTAGMLYCIVEGCGGGGGGGGCSSGAAGASGAGGGSGGTSGRILLTSAQIGASKAVTIGAAGAGGIGANNGGTGGTTSLGTLFSVGGGLGGIQGTSSGSTNFSVGAAVGTGTTADYIATGASGQYGTYINGVYTKGGEGGKSIYGAGGQEVIATVATASTTGNVATGFGGGGGGAMIYLTVTSSCTGGAGTIGFMIITEFVS